MNMVTVTKEIAIHHTGEFHHAFLKNSDGTPLRCRTNGVCKTWKRDASRYQLPVKYGLREYFYITEINSDQWQITEDAYRRIRRTILCLDLGAAFGIPDGMLRDMALERGVGEETVNSILCEVSPCQCP